MRKPPGTIILGLIGLLLVTALPGAAGYQTGERVPLPQSPAQLVQTFLPLVVGPPLTANFTGSPTSDPVPVTVFFTNQSTGAYNTSYWDFGDGATSTETHPIHFYPNPGVYTVMLTVTGPKESNTLTRPDYITVEQPRPMVPNGSFENENWTTLPNGNQDPSEWTLEWTLPGEPIFGSVITATAVPECVHKYDWQLPSQEQPGGPEALILDGRLVYKVFHGGARFGASLTQTITGLSRGAVARLRVPIQVHLHGDPDPWGAESGSWVNGYGQWVNGATMGDRRWYVHEHNFVVPENGEITLEVRFKSKWPLPKDFFIDAVQLELVDVLE
jgi:PKD repeat protein